MEKRRRGDRSVEEGKEWDWETMMRLKVNEDSRGLSIWSSAREPEKGVATALGDLDPGGEFERTTHDGDAVT